MVLNVSIIAQVVLYYAIDEINGSKNGHHENRLPPIAHPRDYTTMWPFMPKIGFAFEYQVYFMIVCPYLESAKKAKRSAKLAI
jgi:hypothetical protein